MISGVLLVVAGGIGLSFRKPIADFKYSIDEAYNVEVGSADGYRHGVTVLSVAILLGGVLILIGKLL